MKSIINFGALFTFKIDVFKVKNSSQIEERKNNTPTPSPPQTASVIEKTSENEGFFTQQMHESFEFMNVLPLQSDLSNLSIQLS